LSQDILNVKGVGKCFYLYDQPYKRLLSSLLPSLSQKAKGFWALKDINFSLKQGETLGIIGRNGAGKSTLLQIICGTLTPTTGSVETAGKVAALLELGAGFNTEFTGRENIYLNSALHGLSNKEVDSRIDKIIEFAEIGDFIDRPVKVYSSGMFVRLAFAILAHLDADILIIDEALAVGDALFSQKCIRYLEEFKKRGSIVFVSHDSGAVSRLCSKVIWLHEGQHMMEGGAKKVTEAYMEFIYGEMQGKANHQEDANEQEPPPYEADISEWYDCRQEMLEQSNLRNYLDIYRFDPNGAKFGTGKIQVDDVYFINDNNRKLSCLTGGKITNVEIVLSAKTDIKNLIVGFLVKNRLGQVLFGENSLLFNKEGYEIFKAKRYTARMKFLMPYLPEGEYIMSLGIASGTQEDHVQHCWVHDALVFSCQSTHVLHGLFGVPAKEFTIIERIESKQE